MMADVTEPHWHELLVVEDERDICDAISNLFDFNGCTVKSAQNGQQAITQLRDGYRPCVILLDLSMPEMDGVAFRHEQKSLTECAETPVLIVSGREDADEVATSLGARDLLKKPVRIRTLLDAVDRHCALVKSDR
jgi:CheY-like chemotaxis protein